MGKVTYSRGQYQALVVFKATDRRHGQVWIPKLAMQRSCSSGIEDFQPADWVLYDLGADKVVGRVEVPPYETQTVDVQKSEEKRTFVEVKVPLVFFSDKKFRHLVAHSQGFGRVGCFFKLDDPQQHARTLDKLQHARIIFIGQHQEVTWQRLKKALNFHWMAKSLEAPLDKEQVISAQQAGHFPLTNGIVVGREEGVHMGTGRDGDDDFTVWTVFKLWTADPMRGICTYRVANGQPELVGDGGGAKLEVGTFCRFFAAANWSNTSSAASPLVASPPAGISILETGPSLKLQIAHDHYKLDDPGSAEAASSEVHIPGWIGPVQCQRPFLEELRRARSSQLTPRLYIEYIQRTDSWALVHFDGRANSPPPSWVPSAAAATGRVSQQGEQQKQGEQKQPKPQQQQADANANREGKGAGEDGGEQSGGGKSGSGGAAAVKQGCSKEEFLRNFKPPDFPPLPMMGTGANSAPLGTRGGSSNVTGSDGGGGGGGFGQSHQQATKFVRPPSSSASGDSALKDPALPAETPGGFGRSRHSRPPSATSSNTNIHPPPEIDSAFVPPRTTTTSTAAAATLTATTTEAIGGFGRSHYSRAPVAPSAAPPVSSAKAAVPSSAPPPPPRKMDVLPPPHTPRKIELVPATTTIFAKTAGAGTSSAASSAAAPGTSSTVFSAGRGRVPVSGSFGASRRGNYQAQQSSLNSNGNNAYRPRSRSPRSRSSSSDSGGQSNARSQQRQGTSQQQQKRGDKQHHQQSATIANAFTRFATGSNRPPAPFPSHQQQQRPSFTNGHSSSSSIPPPQPGVAIGANAIGSSSTRGGRGALGYAISRVKTGLHGLVVANTEGGFLIYTPSYPKTELFLARTLLSEVSAGLKHGSWLRFNTQDGPTGTKPYITSIISLEKEAPFLTQIVQNTVQLRLNAFVPRRWNPTFSSFIPVVKTEFIEEVVDSKRLLAEEYADHQVPVLVIRARDSQFPHIPWRIEKLLD